MEQETRAPTRRWLNWAIGRIEADYNRSADTHLIPLSLPALPDIAIYLKDESSHPTGSLKHRLARSLFLYALCNGWISEGMTIVEASSGSTAVSEAYFARMLGLPFIAVMPACTAPEKIAEIRKLGGECHPVEGASAVYGEAQKLADRLGGHYMDQFTYAERATDWRGNNNIAESIFAQMAREPACVPSWIVTGAGTGGTSATLGRFARYHRHATRICVADPAASVFHRHWRDRSILRDQPDRGHWPPARRTQFRSRCDRPDGSGGGCRLHRRRPGAEPTSGTQGRGIDRHQSRRRGATGRPDGAGGGQRLDRFDPVRFGRALRIDLLQWRLAGRPGARYG